MKLLPMLSVVLPALLLSAAAQAVPSAMFKVSTFDDLDDGEPRGTFVSSEGEIVAGRSTRALPKVNAAMVWSSARAKDGTVYFGTGDEGRILAVKGDVVREVARLGDALLVTSLAVGPGGKLLAGTMPGARILQVDPRGGKWRELAKLDAEHVWGLVHDPRTRRIYAASGAPGKVFWLPAAGGKARVHFDPGEKHLICLRTDGRGNLLTGSAEKAILYRVDRTGKGTAIHDFDATELRDVAVGSDGTLWMAVNKFTRKTSGLPRFDRPSDGEEGTKLSFDSKKKKKKARVRPQELRPGAKAGKGALYRLSSRGNLDQVLSLPKGYFTRLAMDAAGVLWAAEGTKGKVYMVRDDRTVLSAFDLPERQVLALAVGGTSQYVATGDAGAIHRVAPGRAAKPAYLTKVFNANHPAVWGSLHFQASGKYIMDSRSGNTSKPDDTWSGWVRTTHQALGKVKVRSPSARYLQLRFTWTGARSGVVRSFAAYYRPLNQRTRITAITFGDDKKKDDKKKDHKVKISWKVDNPDKDELHYWLHFREEMGVTWRRINREPLTKTEYEWDTEPVPDGYYRIKLVASDAPSNGPEQALSEARISRRLLVDNRKPEVLTMALRAGNVSGMARDSSSPIERIEYSLDGRRWRLLGTVDGVYDSTLESFRIKLPVRLRRGPHVLAVRVIDAAGNMGVSQLRFVK